MKTIGYKVKKTYRLYPGTVDQIQAIKKHYEEKGFGYSDSQVISKAVSWYMDVVAMQEKIEGEKE